MKKTLEILNAVVVSGEAIVITRSGAKVMLEELEQYHENHLQVCMELDKVVGEVLPAELGGLVKGAPVDALTYLARIRQLRMVEGAFLDVAGMIRCIKDGYYCLDVDQAKKWLEENELSIAVATTANGKED